MSLRWWSRLLHLRICAQTPGQVSADAQTSDRRIASRRGSAAPEVTAPGGCFRAPWAIARHATEVRLLTISDHECPEPACGREGLTLNYLA
jgi:hypothetical protein